MILRLLAEILDTECVSIDASGNKFKYHDDVDISDLAKRGKLRLESEPQADGANVVFIVRETHAQCQYEVRGSIDSEHHTVTLY